MTRIRVERKREALRALANFGLPLPRRFPHNEDMDNETDSRPQRPRNVWSWATTPPQSYAVYLVCLILVFLLSFYAGTLKPKKPQGLGPPLSLAPPR